LEYSIQAEDLAELNANIVGPIELVAEYHQDAPTVSERPTETQDASRIKQGRSVVYQVSLGSQTARRQPSRQAERAAHVRVAPIGPPLRTA
jgi:hypothetical protein